MGEIRRIKLALLKFVKTREPDGRLDWNRLIPMEADWDWVTGKELLTTISM